MDQEPVIVIDTREKAPYVFSCPFIVGKLDSGDYSLVGYEHRVAVERKTVEDFVSSVIHSRERFYRELDRLAVYDARCVVIEGSLKDLIQGNYRSRAHPNAVFASAVSIIVKRSIPVFFCHDRDCTCRFVQEYLHRFYKKLTANG